MKLIKPVVFQESHLISTTALNAEADWSAATTYSLGQIITYSGKRWESLQDTNLNKTPTTNPTWWLDLGADNKHAMFDDVVGTATVATTSLTFVIAPGQIIDSLALINLDALLVSVTITDGLDGPVVYESTAGLSGTTITDWYGYFFYDPLLKRTQAFFYNIPPYINAHITIEIETEVGSKVGLAQFVYGSLFEIGLTQYGASAGIVDYSVKETDDFGNVRFVKRAFSKRLSANVMLENSQLNRVQNLMYSVRATPVVWIATDDPMFEEPLVIYGWFRDFTTEISYPDHSIIAIELESLI